MHRAIELARRALGATSPNPIVGSVVLDEHGEFAGEGYHRGPGTAHAEVVALEQAGARARGGTIVVSLEPCNHFGRTGPCSAAILSAGVRRVVYAIDDPHPLAGGGGRVLREAGLDVESGVLEEVSLRANEAWLHATRTGRPFVTWKYAATLDGRVAAADGSSRWITGVKSRRDVHQLRAECDAVLVGVGTVLADDPELTVRDEEDRRVERQPLRVVADSQARTPPEAKVVDGSARTLIVTTAGAPEERVAALRQAGARVEVVPGAERVDVKALLRLLGELEVTHVLLEGGPELAASFVSERLVDRVVGYVAPALLTGAPSIDAMWRLRLDDVTQVGGDVRVIARPIRDGQ